LVCSGPLYAQDCSGGPTGGADATGNQCNIPDEIASDVVSYRVGSPQLTPKMGGKQRSVTVKRQLQPAALSATAPIRPTTQAEPTNRFPKAAPIPVATAKTSKIEVATQPECSGGGDGGTDATGNQCNMQ
jgi:hypothetical protein